MCDPGGQEWCAGKEVENAGALNALADDVMRFIPGRDVTYNIGDGANPVEIVGTGIVRINVSLQQDSDRPLFAQRLLGGSDRFRSIDGNGSHHARKQHGVADRDHDEGIAGNRDRRCFSRGAFLVGWWHGHPQTDLDRRNTMHPFTGKAADRVAPRGQHNAALEPALRELKPVNPGVAQLDRQHAASADDEGSAHRSRLRPRRDRRPGKATRIRISRSVSSTSIGGSQLGLLRTRRGLQAEELPTQPFGARKRIDCLGQHPVDGIF